AVCDRHRATLQPEVCALMQHYSTLINRHLMEDSEIAKLCRDIYLKHQAAIELIYKHRPNIENEVFEIIKDTVKSTSQNIIVPDRILPSAKIVNFVVPSWDEFSFQQSAPQDWAFNNRMLVFQFKIIPPKLELWLTLTPGELDIRQAIFNALKGQGITGFINYQPPDNEDWIGLLSRTVSKKIDPEESVSTISREVQLFWQQFLAEELPRIDEAIVQAFGHSK
ncbi:MAG: hypothetical protein AAF329_03785, partial [Cyanobacteria bacterium P01_A01_bin.17]